MCLSTSVPEYQCPEYQPLASEIVSVSSFYHPDGRGVLNELAASCISCRRLAGCIPTTFRGTAAGRRCERMLSALRRP
jgi:hypothetical protein